MEYKRIKISMKIVYLILWSCFVCKLSLAQDVSPGRCIAAAAQYHRVDENVLTAILRVESKMNEKTVTRNSNGSIDVGLGGTNSIHFPDLMKVGIYPEHLLDACVSTYVAAWGLSKKVAKLGYNWYGVASYHSTTPYYNHRYQVLIFNELVALGVVSGKVMKVPPLK